MVAYKTDKSIKKLQTGFFTQSGALFDDLNGADCSLLNYLCSVIRADQIKVYPTCFSPSYS